ncbi:myeloid differentiation primary response protein MyD88 [Colletes gigas]|uniref:myeloid differentiation primary response protein MyD88 n=1 Tax=Colletes gigas TaxID=935657 RepID=UPI001C9B29DE|nr:myeloid differentiation primary response protein MyD88 [Colletes gigas]
MTVDLSVVPLVALSDESKQIVSTLLNPQKVIPSENGLPRDWRGLAHLSNLSGEVMPLLTSCSDPSTYILNVWEQGQKNVTVKDFQAALEELDRWDILDDTLELFERDAEKYLKGLEKSKISAEAIANEIDEKVLTVDDLHRLRQGLENQYYDAFLLYADEDINFANEMVDKLENQYDLKLCLKDRDLIGGITFEHEAVMTLISERCNRLIVIVSPNFLKSPANKFFLNYAQALGIDKRQRKVIPCLYEKCQLPPQLSYMFVLDYNRAGLYNFWGKLCDSVQTPHKGGYTIPEQCALPLKKESDLDNIEKNDESKLDREEGRYLTSSRLQRIQTKDGEKNLKTEETVCNLELGNTHSPKDNDRKSNNFLQRTMKRWTRKTENDKKVYVPLTGTVSLPSLEGLDTLSTSASMEKKQKTKFINKYVRKVQLKKIPVKS